ncbi:MAG TPA: hypothetical protein VFC80_05410 [Sphaerochaeta sp.]|nr:hypothetical protein [Sphaerochaeta sp.]
MKRSVAIVVMLCLLSPLFGRAFLGVGQGPVFTDIEFGTLSPSYFHSIKAELPVLHTGVTPWAASMTMLYRVQRLSPMVFGIGVAGRLFFQVDGAVAASGGAVLSLSYETIGGNLIFFVEGALFSPCYQIGAKSLTAQTRLFARQPVRGGVRWVL